MRGSLPAMATIVLATIVGLTAAEEEEVASPVAVAVASTLMGTIFVIMCLYYLFNWPDPDIRKYSYEVVSSTVSIFSAVLLFQSFQGALEKYVLDGAPPWVNILANFAHRFWWHFVLQFSLALISKSIFHTDAQREAIISNMSERGQDVKENIEINMRCWGTLLAHITGFASINAWGSVQQTAFFSQSWYMSWLVVPCACIFNIPILYCTNWMRETISMGGDGKQDELEKMWDEEVEEAENDVIALGLSFLTVQSIKYGICGTLANVEGEEPEELTFGHEYGQCMLLYLFGSLCIPVFCYFVITMKKMEEEEEKEQEEEQKEAEEGKKEKTHLSEKEKKLQEKKEEEKKEAAEARERQLDQVVATFAMGMAWSYFYSTKWSLGALPVAWNSNTTLLTLVEAVVVSAICFSFIFVLDKLADAEWTSERVDDCIRAVISAIGILVGFSWEQTFDASVAALASQTDSPTIMKLVLAIACAVIVVPAWKNYMLPVIVHKGWRFGFIAVHATQYVDGALKDHADSNGEDSKALDKYFENLKHLTTGHKLHNTDKKLKQAIRDLLFEQLRDLGWDEEDDIPYHPLPSVTGA